MVLILLWAAFALLTYGISLDYYVRRFPQLVAARIVEERIFCAVVAVLGGPLALGGFLLHRATFDSTRSRAAPPCPPLGFRLW